MLTFTTPLMLYRKAVFSMVSKAKKGLQALRRDNTLKEKTLRSSAKKFASKKVKKAVKK